MSYYIIIRGPLGVGKSTIAKQIAKEIHAEYISVDKVLVKNKLHNIDEKEGCIPLKNYIQATNTIIPLMKEKLTQGTRIVFDSNFYHKEQIEHLTKNLGKDYHIFTLKAPLIVCIQRDKQRKKSYGERAATEVYNLVARFDEGIIINTENKTEKEVVEEILAQLPK